MYASGLYALDTIRKHREVNQEGPYTKNDNFQ